jgi:hypothetical protein
MCKPRITSRNVFNKSLHGAGNRHFQTACRQTAPKWTGSWRVEGGRTMHDVRLSLRRAGCFIHQIASATRVFFESRRLLRSRAPCNLAGNIHPIAARPCNAGRAFIMVMGFVKGSEIACRNKGNSHPRGTQRNLPNLLGRADWPHLLTFTF